MGMKRGSSTERKGLRVGLEKEDWLARIICKGGLSIEGRAQLVACQTEGLVSRRIAMGLQGEGARGRRMLKRGRLRGVWEEMRIQCVEAIEVQSDTV